MTLLFANKMNNKLKQEIKGNLKQCALYIFGIWISVVHYNDIINEISQGNTICLW